MQTASMIATAKPHGTIELQTNIMYLASHYVGIQEIWRINVMNMDDTQMQGATKTRIKDATYVVQDEFACHGTCLIAKG